MPDVQQRRVELVRIAFDDHHIEFYGEMVGDWLALTPRFGLGTGEAVDGTWTITHVISGRRVRGGGLCLGHARQAAEALDSFGVDWSRSFRDIKPDEPLVAAAVEAAKRLAVACYGPDCPGPVVGP